MVSGISGQKYPYKFGSYLTLTGRDDSRPTAIHPKFLVYLSKTGIILACFFYVAATPPQLRSCAAYPAQRT
jgi:hypothetical protein